MEYNLPEQAAFYTDHNHCRLMSCVNQNYKVSSTRSCQWWVMLYSSFVFLWPRPLCHCSEQQKATLPLYLVPLPKGCNLPKGCTNPPHQRIPLEQHLQEDPHQPQGIWRATTKVT